MRRKEKRMWDKERERARRRRRRRRRRRFDHPLQKTGATLTTASSSALPYSCFVSLLYPGFTYISPIIYIFLPVYINFRRIIMCIK